jgi:hypothetical protein
VISNVEKPIGRNWLWNPMKCLWKLMDEYCGIDEIVHGSGDRIDEKMFVQMGMDEMFWN